MCELGKLIEWGTTVLFTDYYGAYSDSDLRMAGKIEL
jgi:hypothetical protein